MITEGKVRYITLGCRVNQYETQGMREALEKSGMPAISEKTSQEDVSLVVINTCTVTEEADRENRYWIRRARREYPKARIVVTGCGVERDRAQIEALPEVDLVLANHEKADIVSRLFGGCATPEIQSSLSNPRNRYTPLSISQSQGKTRAFIKIQDGCNHACTFCKVVLVRGRSRSRELRDILDEVIRLRDSGYREVVFAGIQLGAYGLDFEKQGSSALIEVLEQTSRIEGIERIRLSSIEPTDVKSDLIHALRDIPKCCPNLHIPLQSGDDEILKRMNRRYGRSFYIDLIAELKAELPDFLLTLDVMAGFPGEEETNFQNTADLLKTVRPLKCHVFPYSKRKGTKAAAYTDVSQDVLRRRVKDLIALSDKISQDGRTAYLGRRMPVLVEKEKEGSLLQGLTVNFMKVFFQGEPDWVGRIVPVELTGLYKEGFRGQL